MAPFYIALALAIISFSLFAYWVQGAYNAVKKSYPYFIKKGKNNDSAALRAAIELVQKSKKSLLMYDDGDNIDQSIYANPDFINALKEKLSSSDKYQLQVLFACEQKTGKDFAAQLHASVADKERVKIYFQNPSETASRLHFKIADDGEIMYFSEHQRSSSERSTVTLKKGFDTEDFKLKRLAETYKDRFRKMCDNSRAHPA